MAAIAARDFKPKCVQSRKSGKLMLQGYELQEIPEELMAPFDNLTGNELSQYVVMLTACNLMDNEISVIPENIAGMGDSLVVMQLRNNKLQVLPSCLSGLTGLKVLDVSNNLIHTLEPLDLPLLADLNLARNQLKAMPDLSGLGALTRLVVSENALTTLPSSLGQMPNLKQLVLDRNALTELPGFGSGCKLESLSVSWNKLTQLPSSLDDLKNLTELDVSANKIQGWPRLPEGGKGLTKLVLSGNAIPEIPAASLLSLKDSLRELLLNDCGLVECPQDMGAMAKLKVLNLGSNQMKDVPGCLGYLPELTMFVVENNPIRRKKLDQPDTKSMLTYLKTKDAPHPSLVGAASNSPEEIMLAQKMRDASHYGILTIDIDTKKNKKEQPLSIFPLKIFEDPMPQKLTELTIAGHGLRSLPTDRLGSLVKLVQLDLSRNKLSDLGPSLFADLCALPSVAVLKMRSNGLKDSDVEGGCSSVDDLTMARGLGKSLRELDLSMNNLSSLPCALLFRCPKLQTLMATYNSIEGLSDELPLLQLKNLYAVDLSNNKLTSFGQLRFMQSLSTINVESNELRMIPPELSQIKNLKFLSISQNPQRSVPGDVVGGGGGPLLSFLQKRMPKDYEEPSWVQAARDGAGPAAGENDGSPTQGALERTESGRMGARFFANKKAAAEGASGSGGAAAVASNDEGGGGDDKAEEEVAEVPGDPLLLAELVRLEDEMKALDLRLKETRSAPVQHAVKKQLATKKAEKIKIERKLKEKK